MDPVLQERERCLKVLADLAAEADPRGHGGDGELPVPAAVALRLAADRIAAGAGRPGRGDAPVR